METAVQVNSQAAIAAVSATPQQMLKQPSLQSCRPIRKPTCVQVEEGVIGVASQISFI